MVHFVPPSVTASSDVPLVSICAFFDLNSSCATHCGMPLVPFFVTPRVSNFSHDCTLPWKISLSCRYYTFQYKFHQHNKRLHYPSWRFFLKWRFDQVVLVKQIISWNYCDGGLHLSQINFKWNNWHVPFTLAVAWISFILVVMEIVHLICKDPNGDGSPLDWRVWSPYNTHHLVLLLHVMP